MEINDQVALFSHDGFRRFLFISEVGLPSSVGSARKTCYRTNEGATFYMKPEVGTGRHYNVGNKAFWIINAQARGDEAEYAALVALIQSRNIPITDEMQALADQIRMNLEP